MVSKAERIRQYSKAGHSVDKIHDEVDTSKAYIYKVRSKMESISGDEPVTPEVDADPEPEPADDADDGVDDDDDDDGVSYEDEPGAADDLDADDVDDVKDTGTLELEDDNEAKEYDCGNCETTVEYLEKHCPECGEQLLWAKIEGQ